MYVDTVRDKLYLPDLKRKNVLKTKHGHVYLKWSEMTEDFFTRQELIKLCRGFSHPPNNILLTLLLLTSPSKVNSKTSSILNDLVKQCRICQHYGPSPIRFIATAPIGKNLVFGDEISVYLMIPIRKAALHVTDTANRFSLLS